MYSSLQPIFSLFFLSLASFLDKRLDLFSSGVSRAFIISLCFFFSSFGFWTREDDFSPLLESSEDAEEPDTDRFCRFSLSRLLPSRSRLLSLVLSSSLLWPLTLSGLLSLSLFLNCRSLLGVLLSLSALLLRLFSWLFPSRCCGLSTLESEPEKDALLFRLSSLPDFFFLLFFLFFPLSSSDSELRVDQKRGVSWSLILR